jgi:hypothetical protein
MLDIYKYGCLCNVARAASAGFAIAHQIRGRGSLALALSWGGFQHSGNNPRWCFKKCALRRPMSAVVPALITAPGCGIS